MAGHRILVVDDDDVYRGVIKRWLSKAGYEVVEANDGRVAMQEIREGAVELVVTDIFMPDQDGLETIIQLQDVPALKGIIALTSNLYRSGEFSFLQAARDFGATEAFAKPVDREQFLGAVARILGQVDEQEG